MESLRRTTVFFKEYFKDKNPIRDRVFDIKINTLDVNIMELINSMEYILHEYKTSKIAFKIESNLHTDIWLDKFFIVNGRLYIDCTVLINVVLDLNLSLIELFNNHNHTYRINPTYLQSYIINVVNIYRSLYLRYEEEKHIN